MKNLAYVAAAAIIAWLVLRAIRGKKVSGNVTVGPQAPNVAPASIPLSGEHEMISGQPVVGLYGLDYS